MLEARQELKVLRSRLTAQNWSLLCKLAVGYEYAEIAAANNVSANTLRVRVLRLRRELTDRVAA
jgi:DNA-directed RNA polymerase specialized sigma24 family protein